LSFLLVSFEVRILYNNPIPSTESVFKLYKNKIAQHRFFLAFPNLGSKIFLQKRSVDQKLE